MSDDEETLIAEFTVRWDLYRSSRNNCDGLHWTTARDVKQAAAMQVRQAWIQAGTPGHENRRAIRVLVTNHRARAMDSANVVDALKPVYDTLFCRTKFGSGIVPDDSSRWIPDAPRVVHDSAARWKGQESFTLRITAFGPEAPLPPTKKTDPEADRQRALAQARKSNKTSFRRPSMMQRMAWGKGRRMR